MCLGDCPENPERREFLTATAAAVVSLAAFGLGVQEPKPPTRVLDAPGITHGPVTFGNVGGFLARPKAKGKHRPVLVIAGNRITEEYIPNTCAALAVAGYLALAPNIFHDLPDSARTPAEMQKALEGHTDDDFVRDICAGAEYLATRDDVKAGGAGIIGFCAGGRYAMLYAARYHESVSPGCKPGETREAAAPASGLTRRSVLPSGPAFTRGAVKKPRPRASNHPRAPRR